MPNSTEQTLADLPAAQAAMIEAMARGISFLRIGIQELTGEDDPIVSVTLTHSAYEKLLGFNGGTPDETSEVQIIGVPLVPTTN